MLLHIWTKTLSVQDQNYCCFWLCCVSYSLLYDWRFFRSSKFYAPVRLCMLVFRVKLIPYSPFSILECSTNVFGVLLCSFAAWLWLTGDYWMETWKSDRQKQKVARLVSWRKMCIRSILNENVTLNASVCFCSSHHSKENSMWKQSLEIPLVLN